MEYKPDTMKLAIGFSTILAAVVGLLLVYWLICWVVRTILWLIHATVRKIQSMYRAFVCAIFECCAAIKRKWLNLCRKISRFISRVVGFFASIYAAIRTYFIMLAELLPFTGLLFKLWGYLTSPKKQPSPEKVVPSSEVQEVVKKEYVQKTQLKKSTEKKKQKMEEAAPAANAGPTSTMVECAPVTRSVEKEPQQPLDLVHAIEKASILMPTNRRTSDVDPDSFIDESFLKKLESIRLETQHRTVRLDIAFHICANGTFYSLQSLFDNKDFVHAGKMVDVLAREAAEPRGGFFITVQDKTFSNDRTVDALWMAVTWLTALKKILGSEAVSADAFPYWGSGKSEAKLTLKKLSGDMVSLEHGNAVVGVNLRTCQVPLLAFATCMLREGNLLLRFLARLNTQITAKLTQLQPSGTQGRGSAAGGRGVVGSGSGRAGRGARPPANAASAQQLEALRASFPKSAQRAVEELSEAIVQYQKTL